MGGRDQAGLWGWGMARRPCQPRRMQGAGDPPAGKGVAVGLQLMRSSAAEPNRSGTFRTPP